MHVLISNTSQTWFCRVIVLLFSCACYAIHQQTQTKICEYLRTFLSTSSSCFIRINSAAANEPALSVFTPLFSPGAVVSDKGCFRVRSLDSRDLDRPFLSER